MSRTMAFFRQANGALLEVGERWYKHVDAPNKDPKTMIGERKGEFGVGMHDLLLGRVTKKGVKGASETVAQ